MKPSTLKMSEPVTTEPLHTTEHYSALVSHELRDPLCTIRSLAELLAQDEKLDERGLELVERISHTSRRMSDLLDELMDFSRHGCKPVRREVVDMQELMTAVLEDIPDAHKCADLEVAPLPTVVGDPSQLHQLFRNLISNALKYRRPTVSQRIRISSVIDDPHGQVTFKITDNGTGFPMECRQRIFEMFQRAHSGSEFAGTGIGLALCKMIAEKHGGSIEAWSIEGQGSTFEVRLPQFKNGYPE